MPLDWTPFVDIVRPHQRFLLTTHVRPDGDGLGSMLALADVLQRQGKTTRLVVASALPPRYDFLDPGRQVRRFELPGDEYRDAEAVIVLDTGTWGQLGDFGTFLRSLTVPKVVIDHHLTQDDLGAVRLVDATAEATGRLVFEAAAALGGPLSPAAAHALFVAVAMDTGWFRHPNTTPATFALAARLEEAGARPTEAYEQLFERGTLGRLRLTGLVLQRLTTAHDGTHCVYGDPPRGLRGDRGRAAGQRGPGQLHAEPGRRGGRPVFHGAAARRREGQLPLAPRIDVARIAETFGGGGHRLASGATLPDPLDEARARVLAAVAAALDAPA